MKTSMNAEKCIEGADKRTHRIMRCELGYKKASLRGAADADGVGEPFLGADTSHDADGL